MTTRTLARLVAAGALAGALALPGTVVAADPTPLTPSADIQAWQEQLAQMHTMGPNLGAHVRDCVAMHGSMAGLLGPNGTMVQGMADMMGGEVRP